MKERWSYFDQLDELEGVPVINIHLWCVRLRWPCLAGPCTCYSDRSFYCINRQPPTPQVRP